MKIKVRCNQAEECPHGRYGSSHPEYCEHHDIHEVEEYCCGVEWCLEFGNCIASLDCVPVEESDTDS